MSDTTRCHFVPKFHLKNFLQDGSKVLWVYDRGTFAIKAQLPKDTAVIVDYYIAKDLTGKKNKFVEHLLSEIEGKAKASIDQIIKDPKSITIEDITSIKLFLAFMHCRVPNSVRMVEEVYLAGVDSLLDDLTKIAKDPIKSRQHYGEFIKSGKAARDISYEEYCATLLIPKNKFAIKIDEKHSIGGSLILSEEVFKRMMVMNMSVDIHKGDNFFITSDTPLNVFCATGKNQAIFGSGFGLMAVELSFPITPKICIRLCYKEKKGVKYINSAYVDEINKRMIAGSQRYVISPFKSNRINKMIKKLASYYKRPIIDIEEMKKRLNNI
ncbi:MAG: DUF4238 domain-containing protein [Eubacteriales bacterium]|nr:DUF4238 domain-containing protein [Eubacteriales bacterium]